ncbi:hypothetical protein OH491_21750 [Termitidicoccus mucosus]|uniref:Uncharacterized protein n=1 Tax=Termitidicoccus mucosus TaxID=1184151 RepID=A0A178ICY6_9BACT|nr:hypothetical protein AW736_21965 [Opitutaceae bacterium TSB47]
MNTLTIDATSSLIAICSAFGVILIYIGGLTLSFLKTRSELKAALKDTVSEGERLRGMISKYEDLHTRFAHIEGFVKWLPEYKMIYGPNEDDKKKEEEGLKRLGEMQRQQREHVSQAQT